MDLVKFTPAMKKQIAQEQKELNKLIEEYNNKNIVPKPVVKKKKDYIGYSSEEEEVIEIKHCPKILTSY